MDCLYCSGKLYKGYDHKHPETFETCNDQQVYKYYLERGKHTTAPLESMARTLHDHFIVKGIHELLSRYCKHQVVGVMGGSAMRRT